MPTPRVLITGSRDWHSRVVIGAAMRRATYLLRAERLIIVHGACPTGADALADSLATQFGWNIERHPARWKPDGVMDKRAGFIRNQDMVDLGAALCLAFVMPCNRKWCDVRGPHGSHGASHCLQAALDANILCRKYTPKGLL